MCRMRPELQIPFTASLLSCRLRERLLVESLQAALCWHPIPQCESLQNIRVEQNPVPKGETCSCRRM